MREKSNIPTRFLIQLIALGFIIVAFFYFGNFSKAKAVSIFSEAEISCNSFESAECETIYGFAVCQCGDTGIEIPTVIDFDKIISFRRYLKSQNLLEVEQTVVKIEKSLKLRDKSAYKASLLIYLTQINKLKPSQIKKISNWNF